MQEFTFYSPTKVLFGPDAEWQVGQEVKRFGGTRALLVYGGGSAVKSGLLGRVEESLSQSGIAHQALGGVHPNPLLSLAQEGVRQAQEFGADFVIGVGGGSAIDTAKAIAIGAVNQGPLWDYWEQKRPVAGALPVGAVTTIPAAGSETSDSAVLTNQEIHVKRGLSCDENRPRFAVLNPRLCATLPAYQVACGATDILMHTLERYFTPPAQNQLTDELAEGLMRTVLHNGPLAVQNPADYQPMSELMWCGSISHNGLTGLGAKKDFSNHQIGHELSARYDVAHGASLSAVWGAWATYCLPVNPARFARFARQVWGIQESDCQAVAQAGIRATVDWFASLGLPTSLPQLLGRGPLAEEELHQLAVGVTYQGKRTIGSFRVLGEPEIFEIYRLANR